jgi:hypothetical protein
LVKSEQLKDLVHNPGLTRRQKLMLVLASGNGTGLSASEIRTRAIQAGLREAGNWNISDVLAGEPQMALRLGDGWGLGSDGQKWVAEQIKPASTPAIAAINATLRGLLPSIKSDGSKKYLAEAIGCFESKYYRAAIVFSWIGAVAVLHNHVITNYLAAFNAEALARDPDWKPAKIADDLALMKEEKFLDVLVKISVLGKSAKELLKNNCLALRNACGHPNSVQPGENMAAAHLEILINHVFTKF